MMPGMDGIETTQWIRSIDTEYAKNIPVIALTANAVAGNERLFLDEGFQAFLSKPISIPKLDAVIRRWIVGNRRSNIQIPGIDAKRGLSLYEGDTGIFLDVLRSFAGNIPAELKRMRNLSEENLADYAIDIHTLKGAGSSIGAKDLAHRAGEMERMANDGDFTGVSKLNGQLVKDAETLVADILEWFEKGVNI
jgi:HPt (histidine-containing phosphotransfer) domain-containing protein